MAELTDQQTAAAICHRYGISDEQRNLMLFNIGHVFAAQFTHGAEMVKEKLFWVVWARLFTSDDRGLLKYPELGSLPYAEVKNCMTTDTLIKRTFCRLYYGAKRPDRKVNRMPTDLNVWRKRLIAAIGGWLRMTGRQDGLEIIKGIACRAAKKDDFNAIPKQQLVSLYNAFLQRQKDLKTVKTI
ncbi:MAG: hypothetical protein K2I87_07295 [Bacteroidales bacterium]|nr:hypothetical protein [Bacteroidales bacterium]